VRNCVVSPTVSGSDACSLPPRQPRHGVGQQHPVLDGIGHRIVKNAQYVLRSLSGPSLVLQRFAEILAMPGRQFIEAKQTKGRLQVAPDDGLIKHPRRRMQISTACNPAVREEGRAPLVPRFEIFGDQGAMRIPSDVFLAVKLGDASPVRKMFAVIEGTKGNLTLDDLVEGSELVPILGGIHQSRKLPAADTAPAKIQKQLSRLRANGHIFGL